MRIAGRLQFLAAVPEVNLQRVRQARRGEPAEGIALRTQTTELSRQFKHLRDFPRQRVSRLELRTLAHAIEESAMAAHLNAVPFDARQSILACNQQIAFD